MAKQTKNERHCSFCGRGENEVQLLLTGLDGNIIDQCVEMADNVIKTELGTKSDFTLNGEQLPKPIEIKNFRVIFVNYFAAANQPVIHILRSRHRLTE